MIDDLEFDAPKTKDMAAIIKALSLHGETLLVTTAEHDVNVYKSARNIDQVTVSPVAGLERAECAAAAPRAGDQGRAGGPAGQGSEKG